MTASSADRAGSPHPTKSSSTTSGSPLSQGTIKWFNAASGYGYIVLDEGEKELFVHRADVEADLLAQLASGDRVEFEQRAGGMGPQAINVRAITATVQQLTDTTHARAAQPTRHQELPDGLDWEEFLHRSFPHHRRHDFDALRAYALYSSRKATLPTAA